MHLGGDEVLFLGGTDFNIREITEIALGDGEVVVSNVVKDIVFTRGCLFGCREVGVLGANGGMEISEVV